MKSVKSDKFITIDATSGEIYKLEFNSPVVIDIRNLSNGDVNVGVSEDFVTVDGISNYLTLRSGSFYNCLYVTGEVLYLQSTGAGKISIVRV